MKKKARVLNTRRTTGEIVTSSRTVVESVIDATKDDKSATWDQSVKRSKIARWDEIVRSPAANI